jgi:galactose mutarotase-like enzyme
MCEMAIKEWTLTDAAEGIHLETLSVSPQTDRDLPAGISFCKRRLHGGLQDGVDLVEVRAGDLRAVVVPTRGMGIWKAWLGDLEWGWQSPVRGPVHPAFVPIFEPSGLGWLDGFDELVVRCGLESNGAPEFDPQGRLRYPLHGRIANRPAHRVGVSVDTDAGVISVTGHVDESRFHFQKLRLESTVTLHADRHRIAIDDSVTNLSAEPAGMQLLYHVNFGPPMADAGARIVVPAPAAVPRDRSAAANAADWDVVSEETLGRAEEVFFFEPRGDARGIARVLLKRPQAGKAVAVEFRPEELPCFTLWKNPRARADGYVIGLEPGTNFPNPRCVEQSQGRVVPLAAGETRRFRVALEGLVNAQAITQAESAIRQTATEK